MKMFGTPLHLFTVCVAYRISILRYLAYGLLLYGYILFVHLGMGWILEPEEITDKLVRYVMEGNTYNCSTSRRLGHPDNGGWSICMDPPYGPAQHNPLVYSFGVGTDFSFDDAAANVLGATVRAFDPTINETRHRRGTTRGQLQFYPVGVIGSKESQEWDNRYQYLETIHGTLDQHRAVDYMKLDVEGFEWGILEDILQLEPMRSRIKQIAFELHTKHLISCYSGKECRTDYPTYRRLLDDLETAGFRRWYTSLDLKCEDIFNIHCVNVVYVNTKFKY